MKLNATIVETPVPNENSMILRFENDQKQQHFEVKCSFNPYRHGLRKFDYIRANIKFQSKVFEDQKSGKKSYITCLLCNGAIEISTPSKV